MLTFDFGFIKDLLFGKRKAVLPDEPHLPPIQPGPIQSVVRTPATFEEAVDFVVAEFPPQDENPFSHMVEGMALRNGLGLWEKESLLHIHMLERFGLCHADDTGMLIREAADAKRNGTTYDIDADVRRCKEHWRRAGLDPATMKPITS
jgi:hypothetical protein